MIEHNATLMTDTLLLVGLGNPGEQYASTRHNIGRETLKEWQKKSGAEDFVLDKKLNALVSENKKAVIVLPETMMNRSGKSIIPAMQRYKTKPEDIIVVHDDADILLGRVKLSFNRHSAGHKGVESARRAIGAWNFWRLRIGIQKKKRADAMKLVLQKFAPAEEQILKKVKKKIFEGFDLLLQEGPERAMNEINKN